MEEQKYTDSEMKDSLATAPIEDVAKKLAEAGTNASQALMAWLIKAMQDTMKPLADFQLGKKKKLSKHQATKRGAKHMAQPTFRSRQILPMTPAQYRHGHHGKLSK